MRFTPIRRAQRSASIFVDKDTTEVAKRLFFQNGFHFTTSIGENTSLLYHILYFAVNRVPLVF